MIVKIILISEVNIPLVCINSSQAAISHAHPKLAIVGTATIKMEHVLLVHMYWLILGRFNARHLQNSLKLIKMTATVQ